MSRWIVKRETLEGVLENGHRRVPITFLAELIGDEKGNVESASDLSLTLDPDGEDALYEAGIDLNGGTIRFPIKTIEEFLKPEGGV